MAKFVKCPTCGANLDHNEKCEDCFNPVVSRMASEVTVRIKHNTSITFREVKSNNFPMFSDSNVYNVK